MIKLINQKLKGSIAITAVIAISALLLVAGVTLVIISVDLARSTQAYEKGFKATLISSACLEESLFKLSVNNTYTGTISIANGDSCTAAIANTADPDIKTVGITSTVDDHILRDSYEIDVSGSTPVILE